MASLCDTLHQRAIAPVHTNALATYISIRTQHIQTHTHTRTHWVWCGYAKRNGKMCNVHHDKPYNRSVNQSRIQVYWRKYEARTAHNELMIF